MGRSAKISISVPDKLLLDVERARRGSRETRSDFFRRAAELLLREQRDREALERYVRGYVAIPESNAEEAWASLGEVRIAEAQW